MDSTSWMGAMAFAQAVQKAVNTAPALWWTGDTLCWPMCS